MTASSLTAADCQRLLSDEVDRFRTAAAHGPLDAAVSTCPGWSLDTLVEHLGTVHGWAAAIVRAGGERVARRDIPAWDGEDLLQWYAGRASALLASLEEVDPQAAAWAFGMAPPIAAFWSRRQLMETAIHRVDAELAIGTPPYSLDVVPDLAAEGVAEVFEVMTPRVVENGPGVPDLSEPLLVRATDVDRGWLLEPVAGQAPTIRPPRAASGRPTEVRGPAAALFLRLWKRPGGGELTVSGDQDVVDRFLASPLTT